MNKLPAGREAELFQYVFEQPLLLFRVMLSNGDKRMGAIHAGKRVGALIRCDVRNPFAQLPWAIGA